MQLETGASLQRKCHLNSTSLARVPNNADKGIIFINKDMRITYVPIKLKLSGLLRSSLCS